MNLIELSELLGRSTEVLRVETLDAYSSASDADLFDRYVSGAPKPDPSEKRPWLDRLATAATAGHPWQRLRLVSRPVPQYTLYACEFGYVDNVAAGEDVRVLDENDDMTGRFDELGRFGDLLVLDGELVAMQYTATGGFVSAQSARNGAISPESAAAIATVAQDAFAGAEPFSHWWARNTDLHRNLAPH